MRCRGIGAFLIAAAVLAALTSGRLDVKGKRVVTILTGANIDAERLRDLVIQ